MSMTFEFNSLSKENAAALKGIAILTISLHNFFHNLPPVLGENQFAFSERVAWRTIDAFQQHPEQGIRLLFSYFGHLGVEIFVFLSAYGLTRKYLHHEFKTGAFLRRRFGRVYLSFLLCVGVYICLGIAKEHFTGERVLYWDSLLWKVTLVSNFIPGQAMKPVGPWWFMSFIFQSYLVYPILLSGYKKYGQSFLMATAVLALCLEYLANPVLIRHDLNLNQTVLGHLPLICLAIFFAARERVEIPGVCVVLSLLVFVLGNFSKVLWMVMDLSLLILVLAAAGPFSLLLGRSRPLRGLLVFYGKISFPLFMVHGFLRSLVSNAVRFDAWWGDTATALLFIAFSTGFAYCFVCFDRYLRNFTNPQTLGSSW